MEYYHVHLIIVRDVIVHTELRRVYFIDAYTASIFAWDDVARGGGRSNFNQNV